MTITSRLRSRNINQALVWLLVAVMAPLLLGAFALLVVQARQERHLAEDHLATLAQAFVQVVDRELDYGRGQLEVIAASPAVDKQDWEELQRLSTEVAGRRAGSRIVLVRSDGQLLFNTAVPWGQPLANIWGPGDEERRVMWEGRLLPQRWQKVSRQVFDGRTVYSDLYLGSTTKSPTLALSVPVTRQGQVRYGLTLAFPPALLEQLIQSSVDTIGMRVLVVDRLGLVVAGNAAASARLADPVPRVPTQPHSSTEPHYWSGHYLSAGLDGTPLRGAYAVSRVNGFVVRVALPETQVFSYGRLTSAGWVALVLASFAASVILAGLLGRRLAKPLRELARIARSGQPPAGGSATGIAEIDALAHALRIGVEAERRRAREHVLRVVAQHQQMLLTQSEQRLKRVLDQLFVFVSVLDLQGRLLQCNSAPLEQAGISAADVAGKLFWECHWWLHRGAEAARVRQAVDRAALGETVRFDTIARFTGDELLTVDLQLAPLRDGEGVVTHLIASGVDVQSRMSAMRRLERSEADADAARRLLEATLEAAPVGITVADPEGRVLHVNQAGAEISGLAGADCSEAVLSTRDYARTTGSSEASPLTPDQWPLQQALRERLAVTRVVDIGSASGAAPQATVLMSAAPVFDGAGHVIAGVMVQVDITQRIQAESALRRADRQKDEFLATLSHELRNPLGPIRNAAELIRLSHPADERVQRARVIIERQVSHLSRLVDDLLDVSRITLGTIALRQEPLNLGALVVSAVESVRAATAAARLTLEQEIGSPDVVVNGDATRLHQCVLNLLNNAIKFTPPGGRIVIRVTHDGPAAVIEVQDNGNGISPGNLERIFELFAQENPSGFGGNTGLGIGLALTRKLVQLHGGAIRAHSAGPGGGSTFRLELPALSLPAAEQADRVVAADGGGARVLVVDDNRDAADLLTEILVMRGYRATSVYSGEAAVLAVKQEALGAVLLDIGLPDIDGYEVCRRIRQATISNPPLVIALTGWGQDKDRDLATAAGFNAHLTKPADPDGIIALLKELAEPGRERASAAPLQPFAIPVKTRAAAGAARDVNRTTAIPLVVNQRQRELDA